ncbi:VOC family protein [Stappia indica]|uniref:VOC family protein n=1 Tax=Stappia indica TaxID=538381 RepID=A0A857C7M0_9HYPH|nr:VOC family protein [Stappia indica]QGZ34984.1 VOC family protein [Stappia indica]
MATVIQHLWFRADMAGALETYVRLIPGSAVEWTSALPADSPSGPAGSVKIAAFRLGDQRYRAIETEAPWSFNHTFSVMMECEDQAEVDRLWDGLSEGGEIQQCGWLRDRWGLYWQITPRRLTELMGDPDPAVAKRVAEAMLTMVKLDIAGLEAAAAGK